MSLDFLRQLRDSLSLVLAPPPPPPPPPPPTPATFGIKVVGNQLVDLAGKVVQIRGVNRSATEYACVQNLKEGIVGGNVDQAQIDKMKAWKINAVRVGLNSGCWLGIPGMPYPALTGNSYRVAITDWVNLLTRNGLYVILDGLRWQGTSPTMAAHKAMPDADATAMWMQLAATFKDNPAVIFDLFGEPNPYGNTRMDAAWAQWRDGSASGPGMQKLVDTVRATGATNVLIAAGVQYANTLNFWLPWKPVDPLNQLVAGWHCYNFNWWHTQAEWDAQVGPVAAMVPVVVTEFGHNTSDAAWLNALMTYLDGKGAGYVAWVWEPWSSYEGLIKDFATATPTPNGLTFKNHIAALP
jgi:hypothetical protein